jgi:cation:H+ antiporter
VLGAEGFVRGAAGIARAFGVPPIVVGLTVVAYGTSLPELVVSAVAALEGRSAIALGNVVGSNIANIGLILGLTALIAPPKVDGGLLRRELPWFGAAALAVPVLLLDGAISRVEAVCLLVAAIAFTVRTVRGVRPVDVLASTVAPDGPSEAAGTPEVVEARRAGQIAKAIGFTLAGLGLLLWGGRTFVDAASAAAALLGISERVIGLTIVAVGTSLPELAASAVAAFRGYSALAIGNVVGSNIFNVLLVLGGAGVLSPITGDVRAQRNDFVLLLAFTAMAAVLMRGARRISRVEGAVLLLAYVAGMWVLAAGGT